MHEYFIFRATATPIPAFVAKNLDAKSLAPYIPSRVAKAKATLIRAFVAKKLDADSIAPYIPSWIAKATTTPILHSWLKTVTQIATFFPSQAKHLLT